MGGAAPPGPGRLIVVDTTGASFPFLGALAAKGRVVITATDSPAARYDTVFPEHFVQAMEQAAAAAGSGGRVSIWDVFTSASAGVRRHYEQQGLLPVEHALLDDEGDTYGKDAAARHRAACRRAERLPDRRARPIERSGNTRAHRAAGRPAGADRPVEGAEEHDPGG